MAMEDTIVEIERILAMEDVPASPRPGQAQPPARGFRLGKMLRAAKKNHEDLADEAFISYAKAVSSINASVCNAINLFGATIGYMIHDDSSPRLKDHPEMRLTFIVMILCFFPFAVLTAGIAHSLKPRPKDSLMINIVAVMLFMETVYMAAMCASFCYYLINEFSRDVVVSVTISVTVVLMALPLVLYRRPGLRSFAQA